MASASSFVTNTLLFGTLKLATSFDDLIWLSPFLVHSGAHKGACSLLYLVMALLVTLVALAMAWAARHGLALLLLLENHGISSHYNSTASSEEEDESSITTPSSHYWKESRVLSLVGAICIGLYGCKVYCEWREEQRQQQIEEGEEADGRGSGSDSPPSKAGGKYGSLDPTADTTETTATLGSSHKDEEEAALMTDDGDDEEVTTPTSHTNNKSLKSMLVVAIFGTLDTLVVVASVLTGITPKLPVMACLVGNMMGAAIILLGAWGMTLLKPFEQCMQRVPLFALLWAIALYILVSGLMD